ncbi:MAG: hypothetical protein ABH881_00955 [bacterium]
MTDLSQNKNQNPEELFGFKEKPEKTEKKEEENIREVPKKTNLENYKDPYGLSVRKMTFGLWFVENRKHFYFIACGLLITIGVATWLNFFYTFGKYVLFDMKQDNILAQGIVSSNIPSHDYFLERAAKDLIFQNVEMIKSGDDQYDFIVQASNPNDKYWAEIEYYFSSSGDEFGHAKGFVLPAETKYLLSLGKNFSSVPRNATFKVESVKWHRLDVKKYPDWNEFADEHLDFKILESEFTPAEKTVITEKINLNNFNFSILNNTPYNYLAVDFIIVMKSAGRKVVVDIYRAENFLSGETKNVSLTIPGTFGNIVDIDIVPELNITKDNIYKKFYGGSGEEK